MMVRILFLILELDYPEIEKEVCCRVKMYAYLRKKTSGKEDYNMKVLIKRTGEVEYIYDDILQTIFSLKDRKIERASHVEPCDDGRWTADMKPSGGGVLGPFETRRDALEAEVEWLERRMYGGSANS